MARGAAGPAAMPAIYVSMMQPYRPDCPSDADRSAGSFSSAGTANVHQGAAPPGAVQRPAGIGMVPSPFSGHFIPGQQATTVQVSGAQVQIPVAPPVSCISRTHMRLFGSADVNGEHQGCVCQHCFSAPELRQQVMHHLIKYSALCPAERRAVDTRRHDAHTVGGKAAGGQWRVREWGSGPPCCQWRQHGVPAGGVRHS